MLYLWSGGTCTAKLPKLFKLETPCAERTEHVDKMTDLKSNNNKMFISASIRNNRQCVRVSILADTGSMSNLVSLNTLLSMGKKLPKIHTDPIKLQGAGGSKLNSLGSCDLHVRMGCQEYFLRFQIVENLIASCILGSRDLNRLNANIDCNNYTISFKNNERIKLEYYKQDLHLLSNHTVEIKPGQGKFIGCITDNKATIRASYIATPSQRYQNNMITHIVDIKGHSPVSLFLRNTSNRNMCIKKHSVITSLTPVVDNSQMLLMDKEDINHIYESEIMNQETCYATSKPKNKGKRKVNKPTFSRSLEDPDNKLSDEDIIRSKIKFDKHLLTEAEAENLIQTVIKHKNAFSLRGEIGTSRHLTYTIKLKDDSTNCYQQPYRGSEHERKLLRNEISKFLKLGIIEKIDKSYVKWCSPTILVSKSDKSSRLVVDYRRLNASLVVDNFSFPRIDDILSKIGHKQGTFFGNFDLADSFFQVPLSEESKIITTFSTEPGYLYAFKKLPQGLRNSPSALSSLIAAIFGDLEFLCHYADDMIIFAKTKEEYFVNLEIFLERVISDNLKLNLRKSCLFSIEVTFLGHLIRDGQVRPLSKHIDSIINLPIPEDKTAVKRLLGSLAWIQRFLVNYSARTHELYKLLRKNVPFIWTAEHTKIFNEIKFSLTTPPVLALPSGTGKYTLHCDGSSVGLGSTLTQSIDGRISIVGYASRATSDTEKRQSATDLELCALAHGLKSFRYLLYGVTKFSVITDHAAMPHILAGKKEPTTKRIANLLHYINEFYFEIFHTPGRLNELPDMLSRNMPIYTSIPPAVETIDMVKADKAVSTQPLRRSARIAAQEVKVTPPALPQQTQNKPVNPSNKRRGRPPKVKIMTDKPVQYQPDVNIENTQDDNTGFQTPDYTNYRPVIRMPDDEQNIQCKPPAMPNITPVDTLNDTEYGTTRITYLPESKPLFDNNEMNVKFSDKFHGSVPHTVRQQIRNLVYTDYRLNITKETLIREQRSDLFLRPLIFYLLDRIIPANRQLARKILNMEDSYILVDGVLFRVPRSTDILDDLKVRIQLVIPEKLAEYVISHKHDAFQGAAHQSYLKTLLSIKRKYYIYNLGEKLKNYLKKCGSCLKLKNSGKPSSVMPLRRVAGKSCTRPWVNLQIDHAGPFKSDKYSDTHILLVVDEFSQYVYLFPVQSTSTEETVKHLILLFRRMGFPQKIVSDRGSGFTSQVMANVAKAFNFSWRHDSSASPQSSGLAENRIKILKTLIKNVILKNQVDIYDTLLDVSFSMNLTPGVSGLTPFYCLHGWYPRDLTDMKIPITDEVIPDSKTVYAEKFQEEADTRLRLIRDLRTHIATQMTHRFNSNISSVPSFKEGDLVLLKTNYNPRSSSKHRAFKVKKKGPYIVVKVLDYQVLLKDLKDNILPDLYSIRHIERIEGYRDTFPVDYVGTIQAIPEQILVKNKVKVRKGQIERLCYVLGNKTSGVYVPENLLHRHNLL